VRCDERAEKLKCDEKGLKVDLLLVILWEKIKSKLRDF
jgi:hypothetical protein